MTFILTILQGLPQLIQVTLFQTFYSQWLLIVTSWFSWFFQVSSTTGTIAMASQLTHSGLFSLQVSLICIVTFCISSDFSWLAYLYICLRAPSRTSVSWIVNGSSSTYSRYLCLSGHMFSSSTSCHWLILLQSNDIFLSGIFKGFIYTSHDQINNQELWFFKIYIVMIALALSFSCINF